ncbi:MAG: ATP-binding protein [Pseudohongiellaceae bacterium]|nr:ATP-binding protein [Pseudohongiellaceae bacterium]
MNYTIMPTACVLIVLGFYTWRQKPNKVTLSYLIANLAIAVWALCYLVLHEFEAGAPTNPVSQLQLIAAIVFVNGYYWMSALYPERRQKLPIWLVYGNFLLAGLFVVLILFTREVSYARLVEGAVVFEDGAGYSFYSYYLITLCLGMFWNLLSSYKRFPEYRKAIAYMVSGIALFIGCAIFFDLILPLLGNYELLALGHLSAIFPAMSFAYAITKHDLLDMKVIVERNTAKAVVVALILLNTYLVLHIPDPLLMYFSVVVTVLVWAFLATPLEVLLITTARRKFVNNWYDAELMLDRFANSIDSESNRKEIFRKLAQEIDSTFELERTHFVCLLRDAADNPASYELFGAQTIMPIAHMPLENALVLACANSRKPMYLLATPEAAQRQLQEVGIRCTEETVLIPFPSPERLEGVLILGEKSNQNSFTEKDMLLFARLISYVSAILYRMTPFEKLERQYLENQSRLHDAEIQLVRSEKTQAIAHATRQAHHEIRTPLNIIRLGARRIVDDESAKKYKGIIDEQVERAMEIVDETLAITDGRDEEHLSTVDINQVLKRCLRLLPETSHEMQLEFAQEPLYVDGVASQLQVLFSNLLKNAIEAMETRGTIAVHTFSELGQVVVEVIDSGIGIDPQYREKIWEPYFSGKITNVGNSTARRGWGLTICNRIVSEHKGSIKLSSKLGEGSKFTVRIPASAEAPLPSETPSQ